MVWFVDLVRFREGTGGKDEVLDRFHRESTPIVRSFHFHSIFSATFRKRWHGFSIVEVERPTKVEDAEAYYARRNELAAKTFEAFETYLLMNPPRWTSSSEREGRRTSSGMPPAFPFSSEGREEEEEEDREMRLGARWRDKISEKTERELREREPQRILPDLELVQDMLGDDSVGWSRGKARPIWAFNMLRFRGTPEARDAYYAYGKIARDIVEKKGTLGEGKTPGKGDGILMPPVAARTLAGRVQWDECVVMRYASLESFLALSQRKEWKIAHERYRSKGLLTQGLILLVPERSETSERESPVRSRI